MNNAQVEFYQTLSNKELVEVIARMEMRRVTAATYEAVRTASFLEGVARGVLVLRGEQAPVFRTDEELRGAM